MEKMELIVKGGTVWTPGGFIEADIAAARGKVIALGKRPVPSEAAGMASPLSLSGFIRGELTRSL